MAEMMTVAEAERLAHSFLLEDLNIPTEDQEWFTVLGSRWIKDAWYVVEIGVEGLPDKWVLQVYDTGVCDPNYTFASPMSAVDCSDLEELPETIATTIATERQS